MSELTESRSDQGTAEAAALPSPATRPSESRGRGGLGHRLQDGHAQLGRGFSRQLHDPGLCQSRVLTHVAAGSLVKPATSAQVHDLPDYSATLTVGGVDVRIHSDVPLADFQDTPYVPFMSPRIVQGARPSVIDIEVLAAACHPNDSQVIFESGGAWKMQPEDSGYRLSFRRDGSSRFHTIVCSDRETMRATIYVDQDLEPSQQGLDMPVNPVHYPLDQLLLMNHLAARGGVIAHAAGAVVEGRALVFPGVSGAGKSTLSRLFAGAGLGDSLLSDDRVVLQTVAGEGAGGEGTNRRAAQTCEVWGTPWPGDAGVARNSYAPLGALLFLVKSESNEVVPLTTAVAMRRLMPVVTCPWYDAERVSGVLDSCARVVEGVSCFDLRFRADGGVVPLLTERVWNA